MPRRKRRALKPVVHYSDRCTICGKWFTEDTAKDLKAIMRIHKLKHPKPMKEKAKAQPVKKKGFWESLFG